MTAMNINSLEKVARRALKGEDVAEKSNEMLHSGVITPAEHKSLKSLSWQIAANVQYNNGSSASTYSFVPAWPRWL
jgi:hypothetical protein